MLAASAYRRSRGTGSHPAFTLVELLVVLTIIAVLAGLIMTGALAVRRRADVAHCASNLTQLGVAIRLYITDCGTVPLVYYSCDGCFPPPKRPPSPPPDHDIQFVLGDYKVQSDVFYCPATLRLRPPENTFKYQFNFYASGLRPSQLRAGENRALLMCDPWIQDLWYAHGYQMNALFADGHVKTYQWVQMMSPYGRNPPWPPD